MYDLGVDTGGTFTDFVLFDRTARSIRTFKVRSTPADPGAAVAAGLARLRDELGVDPAALDRFLFGTTVATNTVLERNGAATALLTTQGMRDVLEIQRQWRQRLFDLTLQKPPPLAPRRHRFEVAERVTAQGEVLIELTEAEIERAVAAVAQAPVESVAIVLLFSFLRPHHEERLAAALRQRLPRLHVTLSSSVCPEFREYERSATTVMNAYTMPKIAALVDRMTETLERFGFRGSFGMIQSNGGIMDLEKAHSHPVNTLLSGPAGGVVGAAALAGASGRPNFLAFDVGGTSTDISLVEDAQPRLSAAGGIAGYPVKVPQVPVHTIGAGGGSIAHPLLGMLKVGPASAGADPGPACYGAGGTEPTGTDAALALGYIDAAQFLDGEMPLDPVAARRAIETRVAEPLGLDPDAAALAILRVQVSTIVAGIRKVSVETGKDPRDFVLLPFGGAGGLYAGLVAEEAGMATILLPRYPSVLSALGLLMTDIRHDRATTWIRTVDTLDKTEVEAIFGDLAAALTAQMERDRVPPARRRSEFSCDMRYLGQAYEINLRLPGEGGTPEIDLPALRAAFDAEHHRLYGQSSDQEPVEVVNFRASGIGTVEQAELTPLESAGDRRATPGSRRAVLFSAEQGWCDCPVYRRADLLAGAELEGPAMIEDSGASIPLRPEHALRVDRIGNLIVTVAP